MRHFEEILRTIGARDVKLVKESQFWDFWSAVYSTPVATVPGNYLYLKHNCPLKEACEANFAVWRTCAANHDYDAVVRDFSGWSKHLKRGGLIAFHDVGMHPGVTRAVEEHVLKHGQYEEIKRVDSLFVAAKRF